MRDGAGGHPVQRDLSMGPHAKCQPSSWHAPPLPGEAVGNADAFSHIMAEGRGPHIDYSEVTIHGGIHHIILHHTVILDVLDYTS